MAKNPNHFKHHLHDFHQSWDELSKKKSLLNNHEFMLKVAKEIQIIHDDIMKDDISCDIKDSALLLDYIMGSPWGAPFVFDKPLLEAAKSYIASNEEDFPHLMTEFLNYKEEINKQFFDGIEEIEERLKKNEK
ncbi:MAG: hypothetical protein HY860_00235 [Chlamydiales bacterium]|nr:hypothetical protein [Chlamydiales bacterium]